MAFRKIIKIDEDKCTGCGLCVPSCAEGAIQIVDGKAKLVSEKYCDGLGACLGECPEGALTIEERDVVMFDEEAVKKHLADNAAVSTPEKTLSSSESNAFVCPGSRMMHFAVHANESNSVSNAGSGSVKFELRQWPVQLSLVPPDAPYFHDADLLLVADCAPFCIPDFHGRFLKGKGVAVGCPKLDDVDSYIKKLTDIISKSDLNSINIIHMEVPCCSGLIHIVKEAVKATDASIPVRETKIGIHGTIADTNPVYM